MPRSGSHVIGIVHRPKYYHLRFVQQVIGAYKSLLKTLMYRESNTDIIIYKTFETVLKKTFNDIEVMRIMVSILSLHTFLKYNILNNNKMFNVNVVFDNT